MRPSMTGDTDVKFNMIGVAAVAVALLLAGCGTPSPQTSTSPSTATSVAAKKVPDVAGKPFSEARDLVAAAGITYETVGSDGVKFTDKPDGAVIVVSSDPAAGDELQPGTAVTFKINGTEAEVTAAARQKGSGGCQGGREGTVAAVQLQMLTLGKRHHGERQPVVHQAPGNLGGPVFPEV